MIWTAPAKAARAEIRVKGSRFMGDLARATSDVEAVAHLERLQAEFPRATHHCWAFRTHDPAGRVVERSSDAGEPGGTAGLPILRALQSASLEEASLVVVRWFGGTKLGVGPLGRAYREAATAAAEAAGSETRRRLDVLEVRFDFDLSGAVRRVVHRADARVREERAEAQALMILETPAGQGDGLARTLLDATAGRAGVQSLGSVTGRTRDDKADEE